MTVTLGPAGGRPQRSMGVEKESCPTLRSPEVGPRGVSKGLFPEGRTVSVGISTRSNSCDGSAGRSGSGRWGGTPGPSRTGGGPDKIVSPVGNRTTLELQLPLGVRKRCLDHHRGGGDLRRCPSEESHSSLLVRHRTVRGCHTPGRRESLTPVCDGGCGRVGHQDVYTDCRPSSRSVSRNPRTRGCVGV